MSHGMQVISIELYTYATYWITYKCNCCFDTAMVFHEEKEI
jgi:hypothetical protein